MTDSTAPVAGRGGGMTDAEKTARLRRLLRQRHLGANGKNGDAWAYFEEVRNGTGFARLARLWIFARRSRSAFSASVICSGVASVSCAALRRIDASRRRSIGSGSSSGAAVAWTSLLPRRTRWPQVGGSSPSSTTSGSVTSHQRSRRQICDFEQAAGVRLDQVWPVRYGPADVGAAVRLVLQGDAEIERAERRLARLAKDAESLAESIRRILPQEAAR